MSVNELSDSKPTSDLAARLKTAVPVALLVIGIMIYAPTFILGVVVMLLAVLGIYEFDSLFEQRNIRLSLLAMLGSTFFLGGATILGGILGLTAALATTCVGLFFYYLILLSPSKISDIQIIGISLFGILWVPWSFNHLTLIKNLPEGTALLFLLVLSIWSSDIAAYFGGKAFGRLPLAPTISPKKTIEGSICGILASGAIAIIFSYFFLESVAWGLATFAAVGAALFGQIGDLIESKIKRLCEVKDSGTLFPGHGGVLDRVDGFLTATPIFYYFMSWINQ